MNADLQGFQVRDASVCPAPFALPAVASNSTSSTSIDTSNIDGSFLAECELQITAPALNTTQLPDGETVIYQVQDSADGVTFATIGGDFQQIGAGGMGAAATAPRYRLPTDVRQFVRLQATSSSGAGDCSGANVQFDLLF